MIRNLIGRVQLRFWRTLHLVFNVLAWRFAAGQVFDDELRRQSVLWRLNDYCADKYFPEVDTNEILAGVAAQLGLGVALDENGNVTGFVDVQSDDPDRVQTIPDVEDETSKIPLQSTGTDVQYKDSPNYKSTRVN